MPEQWDDHGASTSPKKKGHFTTEGKVPQISDPRVKFFKGWFEETLPHYEFVDSPNVVIFLDADLYSSTAFVLNTLKPHIRVGTILYFDEFWDRQHESRAFEEFLIETGMKFELIVATYGMETYALEQSDEMLQWVPLALTPPRYFSDCAPARSALRARRRTK